MLSVEGSPGTRVWLKEQCSITAAVEHTYVNVTIWAQILPKLLLGKNKNKKGGPVLDYQPQDADMAACRKLDVIITIFIVTIIQVTMFNVKGLQGNITQMYSSP